MSRLTQILSAALLVQMLLTVAIFWPRSEQGNIDAQMPLLSFSASNVDRITVSDSETSVLLARDGDRWTLPEYHGLPVESARVSRTLTELPSLPRGWPVARSAAAAERFEVAGNKFQRQVEYFSNESPVGGLLIGTSPGFRKVHARIDGEDPVYAIEYNSFDLPAQPAEWLDKSLLQVADPDSIRGLDYELQSAGESWSGIDGATPDQAEVDKLVNGLTGMRVTGAVDIATAAILDSVDAPASLTVTATGNELAYWLYEIEDAYYIKRSDIPVYFSLSAFDYDRLNDVNAKSLYPSPEDDSNEGSAEDSEDEGNAN